MFTNPSEFSDDSYEDDESFEQEDSDFEDEDESKADATSTEPTSSTKPKLSKHLLQLKEKLGLDALKAANEAKSSAVKRETSNSSDDPKVVVYLDPSKRKKKKVEVDVKPQKGSLKNKISKPEFDINKAKHDVRKLVISSLRKTNKEEARVQLAISLGAVPPKRKAVNYKVLKEMKKKEKKELEEQKQNEKVFSARINMMGKKKAAPRKNKNKVSNFDADFGRASGKMTKSVNRKNR